MKNRNLTVLEAAFLFVTMILLPCLFVQTGLNYFERQRQNRLIEEISLELLEPLKDLSLYKNNEAFWCKILTDEVNDSKKPHDFIKKLENLSKLTGETLEYIIWDKKDKVAFSNFLTEDQFKDWHGLSDDMKKAKAANGASERNFFENRVRKKLGPHYFADGFSRPTSQREPYLIRSNSNLTEKLMWFDHSSRFRSMIFFDHQVVNRNSRLALFMNRHQGIRKQFHLVSPKNKLSYATADDIFLKNAAKNFTANGESIFQQGEKIAAVAPFSPDVVMINFKRLDNFHNQTEKATALFFMVILFFFLILLKSHKISVNPQDVAIRNQLSLLLFICAGLPIMILALVGLEHLEQKRGNLIRTTYQKCIEYLQDIDKGSQTEFSQIINKGEAALEVFKSLYNSQASDFDLFEQTFETMHQSRTDFRAVASSGQHLITQIGVQKNGAFHEFTDSKDKGRIVRATTELKVLNDLGAYYLSFLNRVPMDPKRFTEIELLTEMFYQKPLSEVMHDLILLEAVIEKLGWGSHEFPVFARTLSLKDNSGIKDFFFMIPFSIHHIARVYFFRQLDNISRNPDEFKVFLSDGAFIFPERKHLHSDSTLNRVFSKLGTNPAAEPEFVEYDNELWIYSGFQGQSLHHYKFLAMAPMKKIEEILAREKSFLIQTGLAAIFILISLTMIFGHSFIFPLNQLLKGAIAVESRQHNVKIPDLGKDEFGEMGRLFNRSIGELEELAVASIVQSRLMPEHTIDAGIFDIYGKTIPMADLGGDYFDYFNVGEGHFAVMLGDVAGHGVGASLIMAMAKAGIICCRDRHSQPAAVVTDLHKMICATRSKTQRKVMTFQYLYLDKTTGQGKYANAGGCSPILINATRASVNELTLNAPVLGGFKNSKFGEIDIQLDINEALIFYTDGIVESRSPSGHELGYENFKSMLLQSFDKDAGIFYRNIYQAYLNWIGTTPPQDDMTLLVVVNKGKS